MKVKDIIEVIESFAPAGIQESWDNSGLCIGSPENEVHGVLLALDCTPGLIDEAVRTGADMVVTHHPLIFSGLKKISPDNPTGLAVIKAISSGITIYAAHTNADKVLAGVSGAMAKRLGLENIRVLDADGDGNGLGAIGNWPEAKPVEEVIKLVKDQFKIACVRASKPIDVPVKTVAMCGGAGSSLIAKARSEGAQLYLCGDISYHHFFTPDGMMIMDIGHYESEREIVDILFLLIKKNFPNFAVRITESSYSNPIYYF